MSKYDRPMRHRMENRLKFARALARRPDVSTKFLIHYIGSRMRRTAGFSPKIVVATHHKALTVYLRNIFRNFAILTNRSYSFGAGAEVNYGADVIFDHHSRLNFGALPEPYVGLHVRRDPRDILVSASFYHKKAHENWLQEPLEALGGKTYQQHINSLPDFESVLLFEMKWATGEVLRSISEWDYAIPGFVELEYVQLIGPDGARQFTQGISRWELPPGDMDLLTTLFGFFAFDGPLSQGLTHIRNPAAGQWKEHFTEKVEREFNTRYGAALKMMGYEMDSLA